MSASTTDPRWRPAPSPPSFASLRYDAPQADEVLEEANLQALGSVLWTLGSFGAELPADLLRRLDGPWAERALTELHKEWGGEAWGASLAMILWGYSKLRLDPLQGR